MSKIGRSKADFWLLILAAGGTVLTGCQETNVDASGVPQDVENSTVAEAPAPAAEAIPSQAATPVPAAEPQPARPVARAEPPPVATRPAPAPAPRPVAAALPPAPALVTIPARTILAVELDKTLSSHSSQVGESFRASLTQDVAVDGRTVLPRGAVVFGRVTEAKPAKKVGGRARLSLEFYSIDLPNGQQVPIEVVFAEAGKSSTAKDAAIIGGSTLGGAVIGHAVDEGEGTAIGAIVGGLAGAAAAHETRAKPVVVNSGTILTLELVRPVTVEVPR